MKTVRIDSLSLENFKGRNIGMSFDCMNRILGTNEAGKSTLVNAFLWLLTGADMQDRNNFDLYDSTKAFTPENAIPAIVEGSFDIDDVVVTLKRSAKQKWVRSNSTGEYEKAASDEYKFYIDGLAVSATAYNRFIEENFAPVEKLKLMLNVRHYLGLDWKKLRRHFADLSGVTSEDVLTGDYSCLKDLLGKYKTTDKVRAYLKQLMTPLEKSIKENEIKIEGDKLLLPDLSDVADAEKRATEIQAEIEDIDRKITGLSDSNRPFIERREQELKAIEQKKLEIEEESRNWKNERSASVKALEAQLADINAKNEAIRNENLQRDTRRQSLLKQIELTRQQLDFQKEETNRLRKENEAIKARVFSENQVCPTCGQSYPPERISEMRNAFNDQREKDHDLCVQRGLRCVEAEAKTETLLKSLEDSLKSVPENQELIDVESYQEEIDAARSCIEPFELSELFAMLNRQLASMEDSLTEIPAIDSRELIEKKDELYKALKECHVIIGKQAESDRICEAIDQKRQLVSQMGAELAKYDYMYQKCVEREREWADVVSQRANKFLSFSQVQMFEISKNGDMTDSCILKAKDVNADGTNTATQVLIGVDVSKAFQKRYELNLPIFIDNAEQIVDGNMPDFGEHQVITLSVDERYLELTLE